MKISIITLFPDIFEPYLSTSMMRKAQDKRLVEFELIDLRTFGIGPRKQVDDAPYGGGDGMLLRADVVVPAIESVRHQNSKVVLMSPQGHRFTQKQAKELSGANHIVLVCGRYEGFDERILDYVDEQVSIGNYVLTGGELPAMVIADAVTRLVPGVLGGELSADIETFSEGDNIEFPQYTRPEEFMKKKVPSVLLSGNHRKISEWRDKSAREKTAKYSKQ